MSTIELRQKLIDKIQHTEDADLLEELYRLLTPGTEELDVYPLSKEQSIAIEQARKQIRNGHFLSNEQADKDIDEWLNK